MAITVSAVFGTLSDGRAITKYTMENKNGMRVSLLDYGAHVQSILLPRGSGEMLEVTVGFDDADGFENRSNYQGAIAGPYANRIGGGRFTIDGAEYHFDKNEKAGRRCTAAASIRTRCGMRRSRTTARSRSVTCVRTGCTVIPARSTRA